MGARTRARAVRTDGTRTRERILHVALPLFARFGYSGTSIRRIAEAADVNVATLAYHFQDKRGLYLTVVQRLHAELLEGTPAAFPAECENRVGWLVSMVWRFAVAHRMHMRLLVRHVLDRGAHPDVVMERWADPLLERAEALIEAFRPEWSTVERRILVVTVQHMVVRLALEDRRQLSTMLGEPDDLDGEVESFLEGLIRRELGMSS